MVVAFRQSQAVHGGLQHRTLFRLFPKNANATREVFSIHRILIEASNLGVDGSQQSLEDAGPTVLSQRVETSLLPDENHEVVAF